MPRIAYANVESYPDVAERYMRLAFKAQSQCRTTVEALAEIKNPRPVAFVKQTGNIANGPQQVNNAPANNRDLQACARENVIPQNELLETTRGEWLDTGTQGAASGADKELASVGEIDRTANRDRKSQS